MEESTYLNYNQLSIQGDIYLQHIIDIEIKREINNHTELTVIGIIDENDKETYLDNIKYGAEISLKYGTGVEETLFGGIIVDVEIKEYKRSYYAIVKAKSATWIMDQKLKKRSFNKDTITYEDILKVIENDYERCNSISDDKCSQKVESLIVQYDETDFEFLKRIASQLGLVVIPEDLFNLPRFYFGISTRNSIELNKEDYKLVKYFDNLVGEKYEYKLVSGQVLEVGCEIVLENQSFIVTKCQSKLIDSELAHTYTILESHLTKVPKIYNENIRGTAIEGVVIEPKGTRAKVQLNIDNKNVTNWYDFIVGSNNALYSMPYAGDNVKVYFPSNEEEEAKISFTTYGGIGLDPDTKFWSNRDGKKIEYTPQTIEISAKSGKLDSSIEHSIKFTDSSGIAIKSDLKITIMSSGDLSLKAKNIEIIGKQGVSLNHYPNPKERNTGIPKGITIDATDVSFKVNDAYFEGSEKRPYPIEADPKPSKPKAKQQTQQVAPKVKNEARVESGWKTFAKGLGIGLLAVGMAAAVLFTGGAALAVAAPLLAGGVFSTALGVGVVATAAVGTAIGLSAAERESEIGAATRAEGLEEVKNGKNGIDEKGYNSIRDGEFGGDEEKYQQYKDQVMGLWQTGVMLNMTAISVGMDLAPAAAVADTYLYSKVSTTFSNGNFIGVFTGKNNTYGFAAGKGVGGEQGEAAFNKVINNGGKGFLFQNNKGGFGAMGVSRSNGLPANNAIVPRTSNFPVVQNSFYPPRINFNPNMTSNQALITGNNPLFLNGGGGEASESSLVSKGINTTEVTPPGAKNAVQVYTDGYAQVNKGKITTYIRGKIKEPPNYAELKNRINELNKLKKKNASEFTTEMEKELKACDKIVHNYERSKGMGKLLDDAGIADTTENNEMIAKTVLDAAKEVKPKNTKIRSYINVENKTVIVESWWIIDKNGTPYCSTIILIEVK